MIGTKAQKSILSRGKKVTDLETHIVINKCDQQSEWLVERAISGSINFTDGVRAEMRFIYKQISRLSGFINLIIHPFSSLYFNYLFSLLGISDHTIHRGLIYSYLLFVS